ncbi:hypothetical protein BD408DRAFT_480339 [Parasitella parasitica]|nr:hypothetical protein BD408DRAFT_480339 [Parasitella parasitica]
MVLKSFSIALLLTAVSVVSAIQAQGVVQIFDTEQKYQKTIGRCYKLHIGDLDHVDVTNKSNYDVRVFVNDNCSGDYVVVEYTNKDRTPVLGKRQSWKLVKPQ